MHLILATSWLDPIVNAIATLVNYINIPVHNLGWSLIIFALLFKLVFWPLNTQQFMSIIKMQRIAPRLKALQERYGKKDPQKFQQETMNLYKTEGVNPLSGCWPMLVQYPIIISVYWVVIAHKADYANVHWLWIGTSVSQQFSNVFATSLAMPDLFLLVAYAASMYISLRYTTMPPTDPAQATQLKIMQIFSPLMLGFVGFKYHWPSAMVLYWLAYNLFTMGQQFYLLRRYHQPLSVLDSEHAVIENVEAPAAPEPALAKARTSSNGSSSGRRRKKGTKK